MADKPHRTSPAIPSDQLRQDDSPLSKFQRDCVEYYRLVRSVHSEVYSAQSRIDEELTDKRYKDANYPGIDNLNSLFEILRRLCGDGPEVCGIDFGCGSHWFVDRARTVYGWSVVGYDPDPVAIEKAQKRFPENANSYICRDPIRDGLPEPEASQSFAVSNAVIQHFDDAETESVFGEIAHVLRPGGYFLVIFKRWVPEFSEGELHLGGTLRVVDAPSGEIQFQDPTMKAAISKLPAEQLESFTAERREGWRTYRLFRVEQLTEMASTHGLHVVDDAPLANGGFRRGVITYTSGKGLPTACVIFGRDRIALQRRSWKMWRFSESSAPVAETSPKGLVISARAQLDCQQAIGEWMSDFFDIAKSAVVKAGETAHRGFGRSDVLRRKDAGDIVTAADVDVERQIITALSNAFPEHGFVAEESGEDSGDAEYVWILDPIDGTNYYSRGVPLYSISLALRRHEELVLGIVYAVESNQLFTAVQGGGAFLNGEPIRCSEGKSLSEAMLCVEIPNRHAPMELRRDALSKVAALMDVCERQRMIGVSAFGLCACAAAGFDGYVNLTKYSKIWDLAAGQVIFREAGGKLSTTRQGYLVGGSGKLHDELFGLIDG